MFGIAANALARARRPFYDRIDCFEMAGICRKADLDFAGGKLAHGAIAEVVLHIAVAGDKSWDIILSELGEDDVERLSEEIRQHIEPATMGMPMQISSMPSLAHLWSKVSRIAIKP